MENNTPDSKLDLTVKKSLDSYEANYDAGDWSRMERMLDNAPKATTPKGSYNMAILVGAIVLVGGFLIYKGISSSKTGTEPATETTPTENKSEPVVKPTPAPAIVTKVTSAPAIKELPVATAPGNKTLTPEASKIVTAPVQGQTENINKTAVAEKTKKEKKAKTTSEAENEFPKGQKVTVMGNEPIFGDMIDPSKGIVHETKEKEKTKNDAKTKGTSSIGLNALMFLNADSIKKQKEMMQKDTVKH